MIDLTLRQRLSEPTTPLHLAMQGIAAGIETTSVSAEIFWRWDDDPDMEPQSLGKVAAGHELAVPFDLKGRAVRLWPVALTAKGQRSASFVKDANYVVFAVSAPALSNVVFSSPDVTGDIDNNGGVGDISILRKLSTDTNFSVIQTVSAATTTFTDTPTINGTYEYKLTQEGQDGESNTLSATVTGSGSGAGTPPDGLSAFSTVGADDVQVDLSWTDHGGSGDNIVEAKYGSSGSWNFSTSVPSGSNSTTIFESRSYSTYTVYYRVYNDAVSGYSNEDNVTVPRSF